MVELSFASVASAFISSFERFLVADGISCDASSSSTGGELGGDDLGELIRSVLGKGSCLICLDSYNALLSLLSDSDDIVPLCEFEASEVQQKVEF